MMNKLKYKLSKKDLEKSKEIFESYQKTLWWVYRLGYKHGRKSVKKK